MKLSLTRKGMISIFTVFMLSVLCFIPVQALTLDGNDAEASQWTHEKIVSFLNDFDPYDESLIKNSFVTEIERQHFNLDEIDQVDIHDMFLTLDGEELIDLSSYYENDNQNIPEDRSPVYVATTVFKLTETETYSKELYIFNVQWNRYTGGRDPGENYFFIVEKRASDTNSPLNYSMTELDLNPLYKISHLYIDEYDTVWFDGYNFLSRYASFPRTVSLFSDGSLIEWSDLIASSNLMASDVDLNTSLRFGLEGLYLWAWPAQSAENDWATSHVLDDGIVFKYDPLKNNKGVEEVTRSGEKAKYYGLHSWWTYESRPPHNLLITENDQIYYATHHKGYMHLNSDVFTPYTLKEDMSQNSIGQIRGTYSKENLHLVNYEGKELNVYSLDNAYVVIAESLQDFGYTMYYDPEARITLLDSQYDDGEKLSLPSINDSGNIYTSDIRLFFDDKELEAYNIGGASLVKLTDLDLSSDEYKLTYISSGQRRHPEKTISGQINFDVSPNQGLAHVKGQVILYGSNHTSPFYGSSEIDFTGRRIDDLTPIRTTSMEYNADSQELTFTFSEAAMKDLPEYKGYFIGYQLDDLTMDTSTYLSSTLQNKGSLVYLPSFQKDYSSIDLHVPSKVSLQGQFIFDDSIYALDHTAPRKVVFEIMKCDNAYMQEDKTVSFTGKQSDKSIPFNIELDRNGVYEITYTVYTYYKNPGDSSVYEMNAIKSQDRQSRWVSIKSLLNQEGDKTIYLDDIEIAYRDNEYVGTAYKTDISLSMDGYKPPALNVNGYMLIPIQSLQYLGFEVKPSTEGNGLELLPSDLDPSQVMINPFTLPDDYASLSVGDYMPVDASMSPFMLSYKDSVIPVFKMQDRLVINADGLEQLGFQLHFDETTRTISITRPRTLD